MVMACWGSASEDWCSGVTVGLNNVLCSGAEWIRLYRLAGIGTNDWLGITGEAELVPILLAENWSMPKGGMEDVCRVVIAIGDLMSCEFCLPTKWMPHIWGARQVGLGLYHTKVMMACVAGHDDLRNHLKVSSPHDNFVFSPYSVLFWADSCDLVAW